MLDSFLAAVRFGLAPIPLHKYELDHRSYLRDCRICSSVLEKIAQSVGHAGRCGDGNGIFWGRQFVLVRYIAAILYFIQRVL